MMNTFFLYLGMGDERDAIFFKLLNYLRSVLIFIKHNSDPMCFSSILAQNYESYIIYVNRRTNPYFLLVFIKNYQVLTQEDNELTCRSKYWA